MNIKLKLIKHERFEDAPFIGALICAVDCNINCTGCFNQHIKELPTITRDSQDIIDEVKTNPFNKGIILSGLEWTLQPDEMREMINLAISNDLEVILYTGLSEEVFCKRFSDVYHIPNIYIKFGSYNEKLKCDNNVQNKTKLATSNQKIYKMLLEDN